MSTLQSYLTKQLTQATYAAFPELSEEPPPFDLDVVPSTQESFGHYQFNSAMRLAKLLRSNPRAIAEKIKSALLDLLGTEVLTAEVAGPGFINLRFLPAYLTERFQAVVHSDRLGVDATSQPQRVVMDYSSPNIAKEMHVGHLRSTIIGESLARLFEFLGHDVVRLNHVGDWGTSFGMLIHYLKEEAPGVLTGEQQTDLSHLVHWYRESKKKFDEDPLFKKASQQEVVSLQGGDPVARKAWEVICEISRKAYEEIYDLLDVHLEERGESFYNPFLADMIKDLESKGLITVSDGAKCIFLDGFTNREGDPLPMIVQKSDGGYNYATTDLACIRHRVAEENADRIIYLTDLGQGSHFKQLFAAAEAAGYLDPQKVLVEFAGFGLVLGPDGKKFRTRSGETERLIDLLHTAVDRAREILLERNSDWPETEVQASARALGVGAVKYADLSCNRTGDYLFSYDRMLRFDGNTAAFILYSYVRVNGIKRKVGVADVHSLRAKTTVRLEHPSELALGLHILQFQEALEAMARDLLPNRLTDYLYELAERFNAFFRDCRVEGVEEQNSRLLLCEQVAEVLRRGLYILGVPLIDRM